MLEIDAVLGFPGRDVLTLTGWRADPGDVVALLGPNGSGKTTLLRTAAGQLRPRQGQVTVAGRSADDRRTRRLVGYAPDPPPLYEELSAWEHLELVQRLWQPGVPDADIATVVEQGDLTSFLFQRADSLSIGLRKRLGIALATLHRPRLLLLDEPFNGLDAASVDRLVQVVADHAATGGVTLCSTHQPQLLDGVRTRTLDLDGADDPVELTHG